MDYLILFLGIGIMAAVSSNNKKLERIEKHLQERENLNSE